MISLGAVWTLLAVTAQTLANFCLRHPRPSHLTFLLAFGLLAAHFFLWSQALALAPLTRLIPWTAFGPLLNAWIAIHFLGEHISRVRWGGTVLIMLGIYLCA
ncbi:EamA family transporter [bacterium]|nr:EamA family transporter [bacterium]